MNKIELRVVMHDLDDPHIVVSVSAQGGCQSMSMPLNILQKDPDMCLLVLQNGQTIVVNEWKPITIDTAVCCECSLHRDSILAQNGFL